MIGSYRQTFTKRYTFLAVVHVVNNDIKAVNANVAIARDNGADGAFIINHGVSPDTLLAMVPLVAKKADGFWLGINALGLHPSAAFAKLPEEAKGVWADNAYIEDGDRDQHIADHARRMQERSAYPSLYFGGVAFKYQRQPTSMVDACTSAMKYMDVITTSGPGTGRAAQPEKILLMKSIIGDFPLAIASGITPENVADYSRMADCFLVATGVSTTFDKLDPVRVRMLSDKLAEMETQEVG